MKHSTVVAALVVAGVSVPADAADAPKQSRPPVFQKLIDCRALPDPAARLMTRRRHGPTSWWSIARKSGPRGAACSG